uniref:Uncharacterized protein n=1 Tax=Knipowitschia caucasica TaxID=637954 RepID=A0AAV2MBF4_KNICA
MKPPSYIYQFPLLQTDADRCRGGAPDSRSRSASFYIQFVLFWSVFLLFGARVNGFADLTRIRKLCRPWFESATWLPRLI